MDAISGVGGRSNFAMDLDTDGDDDAVRELLERHPAPAPAPTGSTARPGVTEVGGGGSATQTGQLMDHGGGVLQHVDVTPVYLGAYWKSAQGKADRSHNDAALAELVKNKGITGIWQEYGAGKGTTSPSQLLTDRNPTRLDEDAVEALVKQQVLARKFDTSNPERVFTLVLPPGCELLGGGGSSSKRGLGGYHGSVTVNGKEVYYAAVAYSQKTAAGVNGIDFTGNARDNLSITESHEITEAVTDPNVGAAVREDDISKLGWYDDVTRWTQPDTGRIQVGKGEIGDIPMLNAELGGDGTLKSVWGRSDGYAFQKEWSNRDGRAELAPSPPTPSAPRGPATPMVTAAR